MLYRSATRARTAALLAPTLAVVLAVAGCADNWAGANQDSDDSGAGPLVLYTNDFEDIIGERFTADTGYEIEVIQESGGNLLARVAAERANPRWDVILLDGHGSLFRLDEEEQLRRDWEPEGLVNLTDEAAELLPANRSWFPAGTTASCVIAYNEALIDTPPTGYDDLVDDRFAGLVGQADPAIAAPAYPCVSWFFYEHGIEEAEDYFGTLFDQGLRIFRTNGPTGQALVAGEIGLALLSSPNSYELVNDEQGIQVVWPAEGAPSSSRGVAVQSQTGRPAAAEAFIEWMLDPATQQFLTDQAGRDGWFQASVDGVDPQPDGPPADAAYRLAPSAWLADHEAQIKEWFADQAIR